MFLRSLVSCIVILAAVAVGSADAQQSHPCASEPLPAERLACYDRSFPPPPAVREAAEARAVDEFGMDSQPETLSSGVRPPDAIEERVAEVEHERGGTRLVTLDNGQRWRTTEATIRGPIAAGDRVRVSRGALGSHVLRTAAGVSLRVRRVR